MKNLVLFLLASILTLTVSNTATCSTSGQPENEALANELSFFTIKAINQTALLTWSSANPMSNDFFLIERSLDGKTYTEIGKIKSEGTTNFHFVDYKPNAQINYYRFKKVDVDGTVAVSPVRVVVTSKESPFSVYPTLVRNTITLENTVSSDFDTNSKVQMVLASTGEVMMETTLEAFGNKMDINVSTLPAGNYVAKISKDSKVFNHTFVKQ